jgi:hypothetical protein
MVFTSPIPSLDSMPVAWTESAWRLQERFGEMFRAPEPVPDSGRPPEQPCRANASWDQFPSPRGRRQLGDSRSRFKLALRHKPLALGDLMLLSD